MNARRALLAMFASGCAVGSSSTVVGRWRARRVVDSTACVQIRAPGGGCAKQIVIGRDVPARSYTSILVATAVLGYAYGRHDGKNDSSVALDNYVELGWGWGRYALALRLGADFNLGLDNHNLFKLPATLIAHVGDDWGSLYAGAGYVPVAYEVEFVDDTINMASDAHVRLNGVRALAGSRIRLRSSLERLISVNPELKVERVSEYTLVSTTVNFIFNY